MGLQLFRPRCGLKPAFLTTLPATITVEPSVDGEPESILIRAILVKKNKEVGQSSDVIPVTIFPL